MDYRDTEKAEYSESELIDWLREDWENRALRVPFPSQTHNYRYYRMDRRGRLLGYSHPANKYRLRTEIAAYGVQCVSIEATPFEGGEAVTD